MSVCSHGVASLLLFYLQDHLRLILLPVIGISLMHVYVVKILLADLVVVDGLVGTGD